ncbi:hypothetical protein [Streptomyces odontomachi]|nr:hypothetical protein [Streptomyces sp. ODS25]
MTSTTTPDKITVNGDRLWQSLSPGGALAASRPGDRGIECAGWR